MGTGIFAAAAILIGTGIILSVWRVGRVVVKESVTHPRTKSVILIEPDGHVAVRHEEDRNTEKEVKPRTTTVTVA